MSRRKKKREQRKRQEKLKMAAKTTPEKTKPYVSEMQYRVKIINGNSAVSDMFLSQGHIVVSKDEDPFDIIVFTGGEDIFPPMYGQRFHSTTRVNVNRDLMEMSLLRRLDLNVPKVGICRGGQLLNVFSGGSMYQDVDGHRGKHEALCYITGQTLDVSSTHHQMMIPASDANWLLGASQSKRRETDTNSVVTTSNQLDDVEAVYYERTESLCFQPHPEHEAGDCRNLFFAYIDTFLGDAVKKRRSTTKTTPSTPETVKGALNAC